MGAIRQSRIARGKDRTYRLTERDTWLLEALSKMRFLTTAQLARLGFGSRSGANKRLRKLLDAGLVRAWVRTLSEENVYSLNRAGAALVAGTDPASVSPAVPRGLDGNLDHLLAINDVRVALSLGLHEAGCEVRWWRSDWELGAAFRERVVPDALFAVAWSAGEETYALEVDNRTRSPRAFVKKILRYLPAMGPGRGLYGVSDFTVLVVGRDAQWLERYRQALCQLPPNLPFFFAALADLGSQGALGSIWQGAEDEVRYSLRNLSSLPNGKEGGEREALAIRQS